MDSSNLFLEKYRDGKYISKFVEATTRKEVKPRNFNLDAYNNKVLEEDYYKYKSYFETMYSGIDDNIKLDEEQIKAILSDEDYSLIIAGAGTGKTTTMAAKVKYLVDICGINPKEICVMSYTKKATEELDKRIRLDFNIPVVFDAVLGNQINENYNKWIPKNHELWNKVWSWKNLVKVKDWNESIQWQNYTAPAVFLCSGGFLVGRSTAYLKHWMADSKTILLFCGFCGTEGSTGWKIQHSKEYPVVDLDGYKVKNNAKIISLKSFSSHISHEEMLEYYSNINCNKIYLVHGSQDRKESFKPILEEEISKKNKTTKVVIPDSETKMYL